MGDCFLTEQMEKKTERNPELDPNLLRGVEEVKSQMR